MSEESLRLDLLRSRIVLVDFNMRQRLRKDVGMVDSAGRALRQAAMDRFAALDQYGDLTTEHVGLAGQTIISVR